MGKRRAGLYWAALVTTATRLRNPQAGAARRRAGIVYHRPGVRDAGLQLRPAARRRPRTCGGSDAGGLPARLPGPAELLAPVPLHDLALPGDEEPGARRAARDRAPAADARRARRDA